MANLYVIRREGKMSNPITAEEVKNRIHRGELSETDELSLYPNQFSLPVKEYPEFEDEFNDDEKTQLFTAGGSKSENVHEDKTAMFEPSKASVENTAIRTENAEIAKIEAIATPVPVDEFSDDPSIKKQATVIFERPKELLKRDEPLKRNAPEGRFKIKLPKKSFLIMVLLFLVGYEMMFEDDSDKPKRSQVEMVQIRPQLPSGGTTKVDPENSMKIYLQGGKPYMEDTVRGYRRAVEIFQVALRVDPQNVQALAMLASSYLNLIDSSNKDENTFSVINKLIELSRVKQLDLVETLMAEVEFLAASKRYDAAIQRLVEFSKVTGKIDAQLYYYLGWLYTLKEQYAEAMKYLNLIPASAVPMPRLYYLRGYLHEQNKEWDEAMAEYHRALVLNPEHAKSILGEVRVAEQKGELKQALRQVGFLVSNPSLQSPIEYIHALIFKEKLALLFHQTDIAIATLESAIHIEPKNEDLRLEYYTLLSSTGKDSKYKSMAQMYALVLDGERNLRAGKIHEAQTVLLQAQDTFSKSTVPYEKMGDLFYQTGEFDRAQSNYRRALEIEPKNGEIAVKLIDSLIHNHEGQEAEKYLSKYRAHPKIKSSIDRLYGDLAYSQANYGQAVQFYHKAMARDSIDTEVYSSYANALRQLDQCKDAQFFYSIAQRLDPFNDEAILGAAKCLVKTDSISAAVARIQEELAKLPKARPNLLVGIAEIYYDSTDDDKALQFTEQAKELDPDYPGSYRLEGDIFLRQPASKKDAKKKALEAYKLYSDHKPADPYGYLQRFGIYLEDSNFQAAEAELNRVFEVSPSYPELHYRRSQMYARMGRTKDALSELEKELKLNPRLVKALVEQGDILSNSGNLDEAMKSYVTAMQIDPQNAAAKTGAGWVSYQKRLFPSAIALLLSAMALDKGNPDIYKKLGYAYRDSGEGPKAVQMFQNYLDLLPDAPDRAQIERLMH